jgi:hypothetical protein
MKISEQTTKTPGTHHDLALHTSDGSNRRNLQLSLLLLSPLSLAIAFLAFISGRMALAAPFWSLLAAWRICTAQMIMFGSHRNLQHQKSQASGYLEDDSVGGLARAGASLDDYLLHLMAHIVERT